jgi:hypothetical protein
MLRTTLEGKNGRKDNTRGFTEMINPTTITWPKIIPLKMSAFSPLILAGNYIGDDNEVAFAGNSYFRLWRSDVVRS